MTGCTCAFQCPYLASLMACVEHMADWTAKLFYLWLRNKQHINNILTPEMPQTLCEKCYSLCHLWCHHPSCTEEDIIYAHITQEGNIFQLIPKADWSSHLEIWLSGKISRNFLFLPIFTSWHYFGHFCTKSGEKHVH